MGTRELAIKKLCKCKLEFDDTRTFESYCFEFCGLLNLSYSDIKFIIGRKEVTMARTVKKPCEIVVFCNKQQSNARGAYSMLSDYALGPAFSSLLETGLYSDLKIVINNEELQAHKCILTARSEKFNVMLLSESTSEMIERQENAIKITNKDVSTDTFRQLLKWLYTGECEVSSNPTEVLPLL